MQNHVLYFNLFLLEKPVLTVNIKYNYTTNRTWKNYLLIDHIFSTCT